MDGLTPKNDEPSEPEAVYIATRRLLLGDVVYFKGDTVSEEAAGKHLHMLVKAGQLRRVDVAIGIEMKARSWFAKLFDRGD